MLAAMLKQTLHHQRQKCLTLQKMYYDRQGWVHAYRIYENTITDRLNARSHILDVGCGRDFPQASKFLAQTPNVYGVDPMVEPDSIPQGVRVHNASGQRLPFNDDQFDLVVCRCVLEHVKSPRIFFAEVARVLKGGGEFIFLTPSRYDYVSLLATLIPNRLHPWIVHMTEGRAEADTFPTFYRANSKRRIKRLGREAGMNIARFDYLHHSPTSLMFSPTLYRLATIYDRTVCRSESLAFLRGWILSILHKQSS